MLGDDVMWQYGRGIVLLLFVLSSQFLFMFPNVSVCLFVLLVVGDEAQTSIPAVVNLRCIMEYGWAYSFVGAPTNHSGYVSSSNTSCSRHVHFFQHILLVFVPGTFLRVLTSSIILVQLSQESWKEKKKTPSRPNQQYVSSSSSSRGTRGRIKQYQQHHQQQQQQQ